MSPRFYFIDQDGCPYCCSCRDDIEGTNDSITFRAHSVLPSQERVECVCCGEDLGGSDDE